MSIGLVLATSTIHPGTGKRVHFSLGVNVLRNAVILRLAVTPRRQVPEMHLCSFGQPQEGPDHHGPLGVVLRETRRGAETAAMSSVLHAQRWRLTTKLKHTPREPYA